MGSDTDTARVHSFAAWLSWCRDSQLSQVLERGSGSAAALAILYMEVCQRIGLPMAARLLDGGRYVVLWPTGAPLRTCGQQFVVDAYSQGELFLLAEVGCPASHVQIALTTRSVLQGMRRTLYKCMMLGIQLVSPACTGQALYPFAHSSRK